VTRQRTTVSCSSATSWKPRVPFPPVIQEQLWRALFASRHKRGKKSLGCSSANTNALTTPTPSCKRGCEVFFPNSFHGNAGGVFFFFFGEQARGLSAVSTGWKSWKAGEVRRRSICSPSSAEWTAAGRRWKALLFARDLLEMRAAPTDSRIYIPGLRCADARCLAFLQMMMTNTKPAAVALYHRVGYMCHMMTAKWREMRGWIQKCG